MELQPFLFPIAERPVAIPNGETAWTNFEDQQTFLSGPYKAIVREDTNELISIVRDSYRVVPNEELIQALFENLIGVGTAFKVDPTHSFVENGQMRLQITFPELTLQDSESDINLSLFLHNSYDMSQGIRFYFGAIRGICSNGMIFGKVLSKFYSKHTKGYAMDKLYDKIEEAHAYFPVIQHRINHLEKQVVGDELVKNVSNTISKRLAESVIEEHEIGRLSQWKLLNRLTHYISHDLDQRHRARYQDGVSKVFQL